MPTLKEQIIALLAGSDGLTDRELTDRIVGRGCPQQPLNQSARQLATAGLVVRRVRGDGLIGNFIGRSQGRPDPPRTSQTATSCDDWAAEDSVKRTIQEWLHADGWTTEVKWAREHGTDIHARKSDLCWLIEVKGRGSLPAMRVNYFLMILGEIMQRMSDDSARHSIALPDIPQYRKLWDRLPPLARSRLQVSALFVSQAGTVVELQ
jgi:hypothetical protein